MGDQLSILIVDDDQLDRMAIRRALRKIDPLAQLTDADSSKSAFAALSADRFDCLLLDYQLPPSDGLAVLHELRARGIATPVIMLTGRGDEQLAVRLIKAGAADYLRKDGLSAERLEQSLRSALRVYQAEVQAEQARAESLERMRFLAEASRQLASSLDVPVILQELASLVVPALAEWCAIDLVGIGGLIERRLCVFAGPEGDGWEAAVAKIWSRAGYAPTEPPTLVFVRAPLLFPALGGDGGARGAEPISAMRIPIALRGRELGTLSLARRLPAPHYGPADLELAGDLAQRVGIALDNADLYHQAREAVRLRDEFLSIASHELRTPLTSLLGYVQLLERGVLRGNTMGRREQRAMSVISEQVVRLNKLISALLDVSRLQSGQFTLDEAPVDLTRLVTKLSEEVRLTLDEHSMALQPLAEPLRIMGDELRLYQVLQNLFQNAVKYSPGGGSIEVRLARREGWAEIAISDQGIGIPTDAIPHLFDRFYRAANADERRISGIGLGLYVVREIVALHRGTISVESTIGRGSLFVIRLPLLKDDPAAGPTPPPAS